MKRGSRTARPGRGWTDRREVRGAPRPSRRDLLSFISRAPSLCSLCRRVPVLRTVVLKTVSRCLLPNVECWRLPQEKEKRLHPCHPWMSAATPPPAKPSLSVATQPDPSQTPLCRIANFELAVASSGRCPSRFNGASSGQSLSTIVGRHCVHCQALEPLYRANSRSDAECARGKVPR